MSQTVDLLKIIHRQAYKTVYIFCYFSSNIILKCFTYVSFRLGQRSCLKICKTSDKIIHKYTL